MRTAELKARLDTYCPMADSSSALAVQQGSLADSDSDVANLDCGQRALLDLLLVGKDLLLIFAG